jgi:hypothetical protein
MSAFIVDDSNINAIVSFLAYDKDGGHNIRGQLAALGLGNLDGNLDTEAPKLGGKMAEMNDAAIVDRYGAEALPKMRGEPYRFQWEPGQGIVHALKRLRCFLYQCSEGKVPQWPLFKILNDYSNILAQIKVSSLPEYDAAPWG